MNLFVIYDNARVSLSGFTIKSTSSLKKSWVSATPLTWVIITAVAQGGRKKSQHCFVANLEPRKADFGKQNGPHACVTAEKL